MLNFISYSSNRKCYDVFISHIKKSTMDARVVEWCGDRSRADELKGHILRLLESKEPQRLVIAGSGNNGKSRFVNALEQGVDLIRCEDDNKNERDEIYRLGVSYLIVTNDSRPYEGTEQTNIFMFWQRFNAGNVDLPAPDSVREWLQAA